MIRSETAVQANRISAKRVSVFGAGHAGYIQPNFTDRWMVISRIVAGLKVPGSELA